LVFLVKDNLLDKIETKDRSISFSFLLSAKKSLEVGMGLALEMVRIFLLSSRTERVFSGDDVYELWFISFSPQGLGIF